MEDSPGQTHDSTLHWLSLPAHWEEEGREGGREGGSAGEREERRRNYLGHATLRMTLISKWLITVTLNFHYDVMRLA